MKQEQRTTALHVGSVLAFTLSASVLTKDLANLALSWPVLMGSALAGYITADFVSGLVHYAGDTFGNKKTPIIGKAFIYPFREHHVDQAAITRHNFFITNGNNCLVSLPAMIVMHVFLFPLAQSSFFFAALFAFLYFLVISVFLTNQIHKWAHMKRPPKLVRLLQHMHIILNPKHHSVHHTAPYKKYFCITTGWLNPLIEKIQNRMSN